MAMAAVALTAGEAAEKIATCGVDLLSWVLGQSVALFAASFISLLLCSSVPIFSFP